MPEVGPLGSMRGALSNERPYRDLARTPACAVEAYMVSPHHGKGRSFSLSDRRHNVCSDNATPLYARV